MKNIISSIIGLALLALANHVGAVTLSLQPALQTASSGDIVSLDLVIDGLADTAPGALGAFDVDVIFDASVLTFQSYSLGLGLGDTLLLEALDSSFGDIGGGIIDLAETSLLSPGQLDPLQSSSFTLATLDFFVSSLLPGNSTVVSVNALDPNLYLGDSNGNPLSLDTTSDAVIRNPAVNVPEPNILALIGLGLMGMGATRMRRRGI